MKEEQRLPEWAAPEPRKGDDPYNLIHVALVEEGKIVEDSVEEIPPSSFSYDPQREKKAEDEEREPRVDKLHPVLMEWLEERPGDERELLVVNLVDDMTIPRFPDPMPDEPRDTKANQEIQARSEEMIQEIQQYRAEAYDQLISELKERYEAEVTDTFWLTKGLVVNMPLGAVRELVEHEEVLYIEPENAGEEPPQDDVSDGRARMVSDPYFNLGQTGGWIGLLDTGLRFSHTLFNSPSHIAFRFDCTDGTCNSSPDPSDDCWNHGTCSAAIITANANQGNDYRGVTGIVLDSLKVYPADCGGLSYSASVKAFQKAVAVLDRVIVAEMQGGGGATASVSVAADNAFDAGAVIIAANGNNGPGSGTVNVPAVAHKVIGVGNFDVETLAQVNSQSRGPAPDNRYKPDIQAPTNTETASNASDTARKTFTGTSGATPYAAGAAALLRNWLRGSSFGIDPGQVYAQMILSGQNPYPFNNTSGAGPLRLPTNGWAWWGKVSIGDGGRIDIPLNISGPAPNTLDGALWWPETAAQSHNDIDLYLINPDGGTADLSISAPSVFERARVSGPVASGTWTLRIRGFRVRTGIQTVYWAAHVRRS